ncbi:chemotaxis protein CheA [Thiobacillus sp. 65-1402]|uniref:chemotaxis protein CheA n=1 Tax=Thiobacillus sp. 65-1402 TaxID=1895861 RepID=UPI0009691759|nr:chemotaxis protein CheA [Thiobacillus sp. 65-1402]OJW95056.1 MAG: chemotaxis protein CheA [Thiobacillus sp. 65-1402]
MDQALQTYIEEGRGLLEEMEGILLRLESEPQEEETVNAMFRAAHTIKGSAGLFGLDAIVAFTHVVENALDEVREGALAVNGELVELLLKCCDHIGLLITVVAEAGEALDAEQAAAGEAIAAALRSLLGGEAAADAAMPAVHEARLAASGGGLLEGDYWHLSLVFGREVLKNGMDPISFIRYLATIGDIVSLRIDDSELPELNAIDPESCYLSFSIEFKSEADKKTIEDVFEFVREDCKLRIFPPPSHLAAFVDRLEHASGNTDMLGQLLIEAGILTGHELEDALASQESMAAACGGAKPPIGEVLVNEGVVQKEVMDVALEKQRQIRDHKAQEAKFIRVSAEKLDELINLVGELVIAGAGASLLAQRSGDAALHESTSVVSGLVEEIRDGALKLRMVEIGETFNRFQRVVRDVSKELGKDIGLEIGGAETELDKTVVEKIGDPLMHLVRNAMDHGIEPAAARAAAGKPAKGSLRLNAYHDSGSIVIEVADDGGGLKKERILKKAIERGIVSPGQSLSDNEIYNLVFEAGFSTADQVTNLSGRGVGMDVVKRNIQALRGSVDIESAEGRGTTVRIRLPLTLAIIDGFLVGVGKSAFVVPLDMVLECIELSEADRKAADTRNYVNLRGEVLPFVRLRDQFEVKTAAGKRENIVVVQYGGQKAGFVVDELMGEFQTVIKPLGNVFRNLRGISGSTILGTGEVALILDVPTLVQLAVARDEQMAMHGA